jgi:hypothetical protein
MPFDLSHEYFAAAATSDTTSFSAYKSKSINRKAETNLANVISPV